VLQAARIPALLAVLWAGAPFEVHARRSLTGPDLPEPFQLWAWPVGHAVGVSAFVVLLLVARGRRHPLVVLVVELLVAGAVAAIPPVMWLIWFGISGWTEALLGPAAQTLGAVWFTHVVLHLVRRRRIGTRDDDGRADDGGPPEETEETLVVDTGR
jgi:hypothetical protein